MPHPPQSHGSKCHSRCQQLPRLPSCDAPAWRSQDTSARGCTPWSAQCTPWSSRIRAIQAEPLVTSMAAFLLSRHITRLVQKETDGLSEVHRDSGPSPPPATAGPGPLDPQSCLLAPPLPPEQPATSLPPVPVPLRQHSWPPRGPPGSSTRSTQMPRTPKTSPLPSQLSVVTPHTRYKLLVYYAFPHTTVQRQTPVLHIVNPQAAGTGPTTQGLLGRAIPAGEPYPDPFCPSPGDGVRLSCCYVQRTRPVGP